MKNYRLKMQAGQAYPLAAPGRFVRLAGGTAPVTVKDAAGTFEFTAPIGLGFTLPAFGGLLLVSDTTQDVELFVGFGQVDDSRLTLAGGGALGVAGTATIRTAQATVTTVAAELVAADAARRSVLLESAGDVYLGPAGVTTADGFRVSGSITLETGAAIYAICAAGTVAVQVLEEVN